MNCISGSFRIRTLIPTCISMGWRALHNGCHTGAHVEQQHQRYCGPSVYGFRIGDDNISFNIWQTKTQCPVRRVQPPVGIVQCREPMRRYICYMYARTLALNTVISYINRTLNRARSEHAHTLTVYHLKRRTTTWMRLSRPDRVVGAGRALGRLCYPLWGEWYPLDVCVCGWRIILVA